MTTPRNGTHGQRLREQRQARGWNIPQMARKLRESAALAGDTLPRPECLVTMIRRWEKGGGISERYHLHYSRAFQIPPEQFRSTTTPSPPEEHEAAKVTVVIIVLPACGQAHAES